jgi:hypothetical protein
MINQSVTGVFPQSLKHAIVVPHLKKPSLDNTILKNFRPVSNLPFISKIIEKVIASQFKAHLADHDILDAFQSAYRSGHSTETALIRVQSDLLNAIDNQDTAILLLLDLSAAFDMINHRILLHRLHNTFGVTGQALEWFKSYLNNRSLAVQIENTRSESRTVAFEVPQGSVLGPILFTCYMTPLGQIFNRHGLQRHFYADDSQLYITFKHPTQTDQAVDSIEQCIVEIRAWMQNNFLKLN